MRSQKRVRKITPKILQLLTEWTETFPYDFRDERMMRSLKELTHRLASGEEVRAAADGVRGPAERTETPRCCLYFAAPPPHAPGSVRLRLKLQKRVLLHVFFTITRGARDRRRDATGEGARSEESRSQTAPPAAVGRGLSDCGRTIIDPSLN